MLAKRLALILLTTASALAASPAGAAPERQVVIVLMPGRPYEEALRDPFLTRTEILADGAIGLMTTSGEGQEPAHAGISLGAARSAEDAPSGPIPFETAREGLVVDAAPYREAAGDVEVGLLGSVLAEAGRTVGYVDLRGASADPAMLVGMDVEGRIPLAFLNEFPVLSDLPPEFASNEAVDVVRSSDLIVSPDPGIVPFVIDSTTAQDLMILIIAAPPSVAMRDRGDTVTPVVMSVGLVQDVLGADGVERDLLGRQPGPLGLTSETTGREGLVSNIDVAPTALDFLDVPLPEEMIGSPISISGRPPTELHDRYLGWREVVTPVGQAVLGLALLALLIGLALIFGPRKHRKTVVGGIALAGLASVAMLVALVPASLLPTFGWPVVVASVAGGGVALAASALYLSGRSPTGPVTVVALVGLGVVALDVATGWRTGLTPLLGGSALDGERFFGLGNPYAGLVLSGAVLGAAALSRGMGALVIAGAAAFAGLPFLGADVGGCITLAAAAALWYGVNRWGGFGRRTWGLAAAAALVAITVLIFAHRLLPPGETHVSRTLSDSDGLLGAIGVFWDRLLLNIRSTSETPSAWLAVLGLPVAFVIALRPPGPLRPILGADNTWGRAVAVLSIGGILGYVLNDTFGMAGITFVFVCAAVIYPALAVRWRDKELKEPARARVRAGG